MPGTMGRGILVLGAMGGLGMRGPGEAPDPAWSLVAWSPWALEKGKGCRGGAPPGGTSRPGEIHGSGGNSPSLPPVTKLPGPYKHSTFLL